MHLRTRLTLRALRQDHHLHRSTLIRPGLPGAAAEPDRSEPAASGLGPYRAGPQLGRRHHPPTARPAGVALSMSAWSASPAFTWRWAQPTCARAWRVSTRWSSSGWPRWIGTSSAHVGRKFFEAPRALAGTDGVFGLEAQARAPGWRGSAAGLAAPACAVEVGGAADGAAVGE